jgi:hypothetical protein
MNGMFKNSKGLGDLAKHLHIADCCRDHNLDFVAISKTGRRDYSQSLLNRLSGGIYFEWFSRPPHGRSGGMLVGIHSDTMDVLASLDGDYHINSLSVTRLITSYGFWSPFMEHPKIVLGQLFT